MSGFSRLFRFLNIAYPVSTNQYHNPRNILDDVRLVQQLLPISEIMNAPVFVTDSGAATGEHGMTPFVVPDGDDTPTGDPGVAIVVWSCEAEVGGLATTQARFALNDQSGLIRSGLPTAPTGVIAVGDRMILQSVPLIVPAKTRLVARSNVNTTWTRFVCYSVLQRGDPLPFF